MHHVDRPPTPATTFEPSRFRLLLRIASGGMGTVYLALQRGAAGFQRLVAVKRAHPHLLEDPSIARMLSMEAHLSSLLRHPNVVGITDVEDSGGELLLVMEYVEGASLAEVIRAPQRVPLAIGVRMILDACEGLEALHHARDQDGRELGLVHRDVSPQNILVGVDGVARVADLGIARACAKDGALSLVRGKPNYMAPEYLWSGQATPGADVFALGVVAWETFTGQRLFSNDEEFDPDRRTYTPAAPPSSIVSSIPFAIDAVVLRAIAADPNERYATAREFAAALEAAAIQGAEPGTIAIGARADVGAHVEGLVGPKLRARREMLKQATPVEPHRLGGEIADVVTISSSQSNSIDNTSRPTVESLDDIEPVDTFRWPRFSKMIAPLSIAAAIALVGVSAALSFGANDARLGVATSVASEPPAHPSTSGMPPPIAHRPESATVTSAIVATASRPEAKPPTTGRAEEPPAPAVQFRGAPRAPQRQPDTAPVADTTAPTPSSPSTIVLTPPTAAPENPY